MNIASKRNLAFLGILVFTLFLLAYLLFKPAAKTNWKLPTGPSKPAVAIGSSHGVILASDGSLWTWGECGSGWQVLGLGGNIRTQASLRRIGTETNWVNIAVGGSTTLGLKSDGTIWAWGENLYGQLGDGSMAREQPVPVRSAPGSNWIQVATAGPHSVALKRDGTLWSWGNNWAGQLGNGGTNNSRVPVQVGSSTNWTRIWANLIQNVGQQTDGSLWFWGWDYTRSPKGGSVPVPTRVSADTNWVDVGMGDWMVFAMKSDGTLWAWGRQAHIYTSATNVNANSSPTRVGTNSDWRACAYFAGAHPVFMKRDGSIWVLDASDQQDRRGVAPVTGIVAGLVTNNYLRFVADGSTLGCDPAFGVVKCLQITFQLGDTQQVMAFKENSTVILGDGERKLTIIRALYGNPKLLNATNRRWPDLPSYPMPLPRRIDVPKDVVAFCGGRHMTGAALTADGEVWTWGEALGRHTPAVPFFQFLSGALKRVGIQAHWGDPAPVMLKRPTRLEISSRRTGS